MRQKRGIKNYMTHSSWLWPDHEISKHQSRLLREAHNRLINDYEEALAALRVAWNTGADHRTPDWNTLNKWRMIFTNEN
jgi:hypothetical protein